MPAPFKPVPVDKRVKLWETYIDDVRVEWLGEALRAQHIPFDYEAIMVKDDTFRAPNVGAQIKAPPKKPTGRAHFLVQPEDADRAKELLAKLLAS